MSATPFFPPFLFSESSGAVAVGSCSFSLVQPTESAYPGGAEKDRFVFKNGAMEVGYGG